MSSDDATASSKNRSRANCYGTDDRDARCVAMLIKVTEQWAREETSRRKARRSLRNAIGDYFFDARCDTMQIELPCVQ